MRASDGDHVWEHNGFHSRKWRTSSVCRTRTGWGEMNNLNWDEVAASRTLEFGMGPTVQWKVNCVLTRTQNKLNNLLIYLLTPWSRVLIEKLNGSKLVKKFPAFYGTRMFISAFTSALTNTRCPIQSARFKERAIVVLLGWRLWKFNYINYIII